ncbi:uncharacterized protein LOC106051650 isoform X2 [Biomphalaria glabrata]|uniref:Uncharacterized protein LOC106051650 isoform X2 n=1 Tax=Biomphalaria glabrata TaxID=6526 RepID=A0A9W3B381_BIOGL|nr:uncharacterized protein LOC106051650 isoform X2 [Biomphalaria glabrata]
MENHKGMKEKSRLYLPNLSVDTLQFLHTVWYVFLEYVGATEDASHWWKSVFERRILEGRVGVRLRWWRNTTSNILWELESFIDHFSKQDLNSKTSLEQQVEIVRDDVSMNNICQSDKSRGRPSPRHNSVKVYVSKNDGNLNENKGPVTDEFGYPLDDALPRMLDTYYSPLESVASRHVNVTEYKPKASLSEMSIDDKVPVLKKRSSSWPESLDQKGEPSQEDMFLQESSLNDDLDAINENVTLSKTFEFKPSIHRDLTSDEDIWHFPSRDVSVSSDYQGLDKKHLHLPKVSGNLLDVNSHHNSFQYEGSSVDSVDLPQVMRRCPVENCNVPDCLLNNRHMALLTRRANAVRRPSVTKFVNKVSDKLRKAIIIDDTPVSIEKPVAKTKMVSTDIAQRTRLKRGETSRMTDMLDYLETLKFNIAFTPRSGPPNPIETIQRRLGLERINLPPEPHYDVMFNEYDSARLESGRDHLIAAKDWLKSSYKDANGIEKITAVRNPSHNYLIQQKKKRKEKMFYLTGKAAYRYYILLTLTETKMKISRLKLEKESLMKKYEWKQRTLMDIVKIARDYYSDPTEINLHRWKTLKKELSSETKHESYTDVRMHVSSTPDYWPFFSFMIILLQFSCLLVLCFKHGVGLRGVGTLKYIRVNVPTYLGTETYSRLEEPNPWLGPPTHAFYAAGAVLASCMREDYRLYQSTDLKGYKPMTINNSNYFGCCERKTHMVNVAGTTTLTECISMTNELGQWTRGVICSHRNPSLNSVAHIIKPCCVGYHGECQMVSNEHCLFLNGIFHVDCDHCVQIGSNIEPDLPQVGSTSGAGGIVGVAVLELFQAWRFMQHPSWEAIKLVCLVALFLFLGTVHLISLFAFIGGVFVGMMGCLTIVPYITFGRRLSHLRFRLVLIGFCLLLPTLISIQILFHFVQDTKLCPNCAEFECIQYTYVMCQTYNK